MLEYEVGLGDLDHSRWTTIAIRYPTWLELYQENLNSKTAPDHTYYSKKNAFGSGYFNFIYAQRIFLYNYISIAQYKYTDL